MECFFCGGTVDFPAEVEGGLDEMILIISGGFSCPICHIRMKFSPHVKITFRDSDQPGGVIGNHFFMSCPAKYCSGHICIFLEDAKEKRYEFKSISEANRNKHLASRGYFDAFVKKFSSSCTECNKVWEIDIPRQSIFFETKRNIKGGKV